jgi:hypothetical protein
MTEMTEMTEKAAKIRKSMGPRRDPISYRVEEDIVIPAGTILRSMGDGRFQAPIGLTGQFVLTVKPGDILSHFKRVVAA